MWCSLTKATTATQCQASNLSYSLTQSRQWVAKKTQTVALGVILGLGGGFWLINEVLTPQTVVAYTVRVNLPVNRQYNESYKTLIQRAKAVALETTEQKFYQNIRVTDVSVIVVGQNQGAIAPVLSLTVSRPQWHSHMATCGKKQSLSNCLANRQRWVRYFSDARSLLGFEDVAKTITTDVDNPAPTPNQTPQPETNTAPTPSQSPQPDADAEDHGPQSPDAVIPVDAPDSSQNQITSPKSDSDSPSTSTPADTPEAPSAAPPTSDDSTAQ